MNELPLPAWVIAEMQSRPVPTDGPRLHLMMNYSPLILLSPAEMANVITGGSVYAQRDPFVPEA